MSAVTEHAEHHEHHGHAHGAEEPHIPTDLYFIKVAIILAGITAMVRRVLTFGVEPVEPLDVGMTLAAILVLTVAIVFIRRQDGTIYD